MTVGGPDDLGRWRPSLQRDGRHLAGPARELEEAVQGAAADSVSDGVAPSCAPDDDDPRWRRRSSSTPGEPGRRRRRAAAGAPPKPDRASRSCCQTCLRSAGTTPTSPRWTPEPIGQSADLARRSADDAAATRRAARLPDRVPAAAEPLHRGGDRRRVDRILRNLLSTAVEHGEGKDVYVTVAGDRDASPWRSATTASGWRQGEETAGLRTVLAGGPGAGPPLPGGTGLAWRSPLRTRTARRLATGMG